MDSSKKSQPIQNKPNLLNELISNNILFFEDWNELDSVLRDELSWVESNEELLNRLVELKLVTQYQADRILAGTRFGLVLGNYRIVERLGAGGMGIVFKGEHFIMRRLAAIKVLPFRGKEDDYLLRRFRTELRTVASLNHPNIVCAFDGGVEFSGDHSYPDIYYFVMEYINGTDLESVVTSKQTLSIQHASDIVYQICMALDEAYKHGLVHRDIKPSNIMITNSGVAKLLDFGLVRRSGHAMTDPGTVLGTFDYLAPEQAKDASKVDIRADIYSLGATLYYCLTGSCPFPQPANKTLNLLARLHQEPPNVRTIRSDVPQSLEDIIKKMMAVKPENRYQDPLSVLHAIYPFTITSTNHDNLVNSSKAVPYLNSPSDASRLVQILVVDDEPEVLNFMKLALGGVKAGIVVATTTQEALQIAEHTSIDLLITDVEMPEMTGPQLISKISSLPLQINIQCMLISGAYTEEQLSHYINNKVIDIIRKPFTRQQLVARVMIALSNIKQRNESTRQIQGLIDINGELERCYQNSLYHSNHGKSVLLQSLLELISAKIQEPVTHISRMKQYVSRFVTNPVAVEEFKQLEDAEYVSNLENAALLHDIGKITLPDTILNKGGVFGEEERILMQQHTEAGAAMLQSLRNKYNKELPFLDCAIEVALHHHERHNGSGYPRGLSGEAIPLSARIVGVLDVYDALRSERPYRPGVSHQSAMKIITSCCNGQFDDKVIRILNNCEQELQDVFQKNR